MLLEGMSTRSFPLLDEKQTHSHSPRAIKADRAQSAWRYMLRVCYCARTEGLTAVVVCLFSALSIAHHASAAGSFLLLLCETMSEQPQVSAPGTPPGGQIRSPAVKNNNPKAPARLTAKKRLAAAGGSANNLVKPRVTRRELKKLTEMDLEEKDDIPGCTLLERAIQNALDCLSWKVVTDVLFIFHCVGSVQHFDFRSSSETVWGRHDERVDHTEQLA